MSDYTDQAQDLSILDELAEVAGEAVSSSSSDLDFEFVGGSGKRRSERKIPWAKIPRAAAFVMACKQRGVTSKRTFKLPQFLKILNEELANPDREINDEDRSPFTYETLPQSYRKIAAALRASVIKRLAGQLGRGEPLALEAAEEFQLPEVVKRTKSSD